MWQPSVPQWLSFYRLFLFCFLFLFFFAQHLLVMRKSSDIIEPFSPYVRSACSILLSLVKANQSITWEDKLTHVQLSEQANLVNYIYIISMINNQTRDSWLTFNFMSNIVLRAHTWLFLGVIQVYSWIFLKVN